MSVDNAPKTLEEQEAVAELPRRMGTGEDKEPDSVYLERAAEKLGHLEAVPPEARYTPDGVRLARKVLKAPSVKERIDAIMRGDFDGVKLGQREPGSEG